MVHSINDRVACACACDVDGLCIMSPLSHVSVRVHFCMCSCMCLCESGYMCVSACPFLYVLVRACVCVCEYGYMCLCEADLPFELPCVNTRRHHSTPHSRLAPTSTPTRGLP